MSRSSNACTVWTGKWTWFPTLPAGRVQELRRQAAYVCGEMWRVRSKFMQVTKQKGTGAVEVGIL